MITTLITTDCISAAIFAEKVKSDNYGAVVTFSGDVRNNDGGKVVTSLTYEIHPSAPEVLREIVTEIVNQFDVGNVAVAHRYGAVAIGESAFVVSVSAVHRGPALAVCAKIIDNVKAKLPIWKYQVFADGSDEWVNCA